MLNPILDKFNTECTAYINAELNTRLLATSSSSDKSAATQHYFHEYQRCLEQQMNFVNYFNEQQASLDALKSCETVIDAFSERLKSIHQYELKENEVFEQILHELTKINTSSKEERIRLLGQIDELIAQKAKLTSSTDGTPSSTNPLSTKSSDTFKNLL